MLPGNEIRGQKLRKQELEYGTKKPGVAIHPHQFFFNTGLNCTLRNGRRRQTLCSDDVVRSTANGIAV